MAIAIVSATLIASTVFVPSAFAEGSEPLQYLIKDLFAATPEYWTDSALKNTYWVDVEKKEITDGNDGKTYYGVFPKYLKSPSETAIADFPFNSLDGMTSTPNAGIVNSFNTYWFFPVGMEFEERYGYLAGHDTAEGDTKPGQHPTKPIENRVNPFGFGENDLLTQDEIKNPVDKLKIYGDLRLKDVTDSKAVGELQPGDKLNLDFSVNIPWFKRYLNGWTLNYTRVGGMRDEDVEKFHNSYGKVDAGFAFTLDIPDGVEVANDASATISGIKGFSPSVTKTTDGKTLIVTLKKDNPGTTQKWQDIISEVKNVDTSNIMISVTGLSVKKTASEGKQYRIRGTVSGFYDFANSLTENFVKATTAREEDRANRSYFFFAAEQDASGLDNNGEENKPKQISYSFQVKKPNNPRPNPNKPVPGRIDGNDRIDTATNLSKKYYDRAKTVIVVRHDLFPDSMTASVLAKLKDAPILLNPTNKLDPRVGAEIKRLGASEVIIVGGQNSISEKVREELRIYDADKDVERIAGHDRYGTSEMVARRVVGITGKKNKAVVASGEVFPDALAVGTYASREGYPILLVRKDLVPTQITKAIKDLEIKNTYIAGGYNTISKSTEMKLPGVLERMAGKTRYETAIAIARSKFADSKEVYIASGEEFADALAISPMSGKYNRPTLLVKSKAGQNKIVSDYVYFKNINRITAIGGYRYIPNDVLKELVN